MPSDGKSEPCTVPKRSTDSCIQAPDSNRAKNSEPGNVSNEIKQNEESKNLQTVSPQSILSRDCKVQTLTVSDQHATLLLTHERPDGDYRNASHEDNGKCAESTSSSFQSLLKLTLVPFHKALLGSNPVVSPEDNVKPDLKLLNHNPAASAQIVSFLRDYEFKLKSESGAEYSYYVGKPSSQLRTIPEKINEPSEQDTKMEESLVSGSNAFGTFDVELISPATERQIYRAMPSFGSTLIHETPEMYETIVQPFIKSIVDGNSLGWINNVIEVKKEKERLLVNSPLFIVNIDTKWRSHPPPLTTPREEWHGHKSVEDLYCLGIVKEKGIASLRDLTGKHITLLKQLQKEGFEAIEKIYGVKSDQIRCFVHYQPQFYHFHVHFTRLENEVGSTVERGHLVGDIIQNLEMDPLYYKKRTITYKLKRMTPLHNLIANSF